MVEKLYFETNMNIMKNYKSRYLEMICHSGFFLAKVTCLLKKKKILERIF